MADEKEVTSKVMDDLMEEMEKKESEELFKPPTVQVIVNVGGHPEPDGDEEGELKKLTGEK